MSCLFEQIFFKRIRLRMGIGQPPCIHILLLISPISRLAELWLKHFSGIIFYPHASKGFKVKRLDLNIMIYFTKYIPLNEIRLVKRIWYSYFALNMFFQGYMANWICCVKNALSHFPLIKKNSIFTSYIYCIFFFGGGCGCCFVVEADRLCEIASCGCTDARERVRFRIYYICVIAR